MSANELLERYLQAVGQLLASSTREDTVAELRANLLEQMDARADELGHALSHIEAAEILRAHGRPEVVAARYLPQRSLIGPGLFPIYLLTLRKALPFVVLIYVIARGFALVADAIRPHGAQAASQIALLVVSLIAQMIPTLLIFWATVTIVFATMEYVQERRGGSAGWISCAWDPGKLPPVKPDGGATQRRSLAHRIADLVVHCLATAYVLAIPTHPSLLLGPGLDYLGSRHVGFAPVWHTWFLLLVAHLLVQLIAKVVAIVAQDGPLVIALYVAANVLSIVGAGVMAFAGEYFVPTSAATDLTTLASVNYGIAMASRIALFFAVLGLLTNSWKSIKRRIPAERFAF